MPTWILLAILPHEPATITDRVDLIERNHVICLQTGTERLEQVIYWRWDERTNGRRVVAWRMFRGPSRVVRIGDEIRESWEDGPVRREIWARRYVETWTDVDPELIDRERLPVDLRDGLRRGNP